MSVRQCADEEGVTRTHRPQRSPPFYQWNRYTDSGFVAKKSEATPMEQRCLCVTCLLFHRHCFFHCYLLFMRYGNLRLILYRIPAHQRRLPTPIKVALGPWLLTRRQCHITDILLKILLLFMVDQ